MMNLLFLMVSATIRTTTKKTIKSVVGGQERVDVISRCLLNLYRWRKRINNELSLILYLSHPEELSVIRIPMSSIKSKLADELDSIQEVVDILSNPKDFNLNIEKISFEELLRKLASDADFYYFTPEGNLLEEYSMTFESTKSICFVLGSQYDLSQEQEEHLYNLGAVPVSLGKRNYLASHVITIACHYILKMQSSSNKPIFGK
jgi:tRNA pseudouridine-54 N-methylase